MFLLNSKRYLGTNWEVNIFLFVVKMNLLSDNIDLEQPDYLDSYKKIVSKLKKK